MKMKGLLILALCAALLCGAAAAEEALCAPVEATVAELDVALEAAETPGGAEGLAVEAAPGYDGGVVLEGTGLIAEYDDVADGGPRGVSDAEMIDDDGADDGTGDGADDGAGDGADDGAGATDNKIGDSVWWTLSDDGTLTITGTGPVSGCPWVFDENAAVYHLVVGEGITSLPAYAFYQNATLKSAILPATLEEVSYACFWKCESLETVSMAGGASIGDYAFLGTKLTALVLPDSVVTVGRSAFKDASIEAIEIGNGVQEIGAYAFSGTQLTALKLPDSVLTVGEHAFEGAPIEALELGNGVQEIGSYAFSGTKLTALVLPGSAQTVGEYAFKGAPIEALEIGEGVRQIEPYAFSGAKLTALKLPGSVQTVGENAFVDVPIETLEIGNGVREIGAYAFTGAKLTRLALPGNVERIAPSAFASVPIETLELGNGVQEIGAYAFSGTKLTSVTLPASVQSVGDGAFQAGSLRAVTFEGAPRLGKGIVMSYSSARELRFLGGVPQFDEAAFNETVIVAMYPGDDPAWTAEVRKDYGGKATWVALSADEVSDGARAKSDRLKPETGRGYRVYTVNNGDGTHTRVIPTGKGVAVEIYDSAAGKLTWKKKLKQELPLWGGFYSGSKYNFLVFGQENREQDDRREVVRVVRYTKNWNRVDAAVVRGNNTVVPFDFGSMDMAQSGDMLYLHTAHLMYKSSDGANHQANFDIDVYIPSMQATVVKGAVSYFGTGYVSHSFDQYIIRDGRDIVQMDLGDAYPRAVAMYRWKGGAGSAVKSGSQGEGLEVLRIAGEIGNNYTGVTLAGLEAAKQCYIVAGVSVSQKGKSPSGPQNVFVATVDKGNFTEGGVKLSWLTKYKGKNKLSLSSPRLVKLKGDVLMLLWTENRERTRYVYLDGSGAAASPIYTVKGMLTGGRPMVSGGEVSWVYDDGDSLYLASLPGAGKLAAPQIKSIVNTDKGLEIRWSKVEGATGCRVYRRTPGKKWSLRATVKGATGYVDAKVEGGKQYHYMVRAFKGKTVSGYHDTGKPVLRLLAPESVNVSGDGWSLTVKWKRAAGARGYMVYRRSGKGKWKLIGTVSEARRTSYLDWSVNPDKAYSYKVKAFSGDVTSAFSAATKATKP